VEISLKSGHFIQGNIIKNNDASAGGGVYCLECEPLITSNTLTGNAGGYVYCSIYCENANAQIIGNTISGNHSGVSCTYCNPLIEGNRITYNTSPGVACSHASPTIRYNYIANNTGAYGGIFCLMDSHPLIIGDTIVANAGSYGGGITCIGWCTPMIDSNVISDNSGSGVYLEEGSYATVTHNTITGNSDENGGGVFCIASANDIMYNTISDNNASQFGGGMYLCAGSSPSVRFNTITNNTADSLGDGIYTIGSYPVVDSNNIFNNGYGAFNASTSQMLMAEYNWWGDPTGPYHPAFNPGGLGDSTNLLVDPVPFLTDSVTGVMEHSDQCTPVVFSLQQNLPNPFTEITTIHYSCAAFSHVIIKVYNSIGQEITTLVNEPKGIGQHSIIWDAKGLSNGIYFYQMTVGGSQETRKCLLVH